MKNNKALITTTTPYMIKQFLMNDIKLLKELGYKIEVATNWQTFNVISDEELIKFKNELESNDIRINQIDFERNMMKLRYHLKSYKQMKQLMNKENITLFIHIRLYQV